MKKHIPIILAAAFLAASCHKDTEHVDVLRRLTCKVPCLSYPKIL